MTAALELAQAPPLSTPVRFFLTAPWFGAGAGALLAVRADAVLASRWTPDALAVVHLLTLGFMLQVMLGALLQFLPVAAGVSVWRPRWVAGLTHVGLTLGTGLLAWGFVQAEAVAMRAAVVVLPVTIGCFVAVIGVGLARSKAIGPTLLALRLSTVGLVITVGLGATLASAFGWGLAVSLVPLTAVHAAWGLLGWGLVLVAGVAGLVVPMFQLTPPYPVAFSRALPLVVLGALALWSAGAWAGSDELAWLAGGLLAGAVTSFAIATLRLQAQRKRRVLDTTFWSWRVGMICLLLAVPVGLAILAGPEEPLRARLEYLLGVLLLAGAFPALIGGMLYKIVPFLCWLHLERITRSPPHMHQVLPEKWARWQLRLFVVALGCLCLGALWPPLVAAGGALFAASCLGLELNLLRALSVYRRARATAPPRTA